MAIMARQVAPHLAWKNGRVQKSCMAASFSLARNGCDSQHRGPTSARIRVGLRGGLESKKKEKKKKKKKKKEEKKKK